MCHHPSTLSHSLHTQPTLIVFVFLSLVPQKTLNTTKSSEPNNDEHAAKSKQPDGQTTRPNGSPAATTTTSSSITTTTEADRNPALQQCITELSSNLRRTGSDSEQPPVQQVRGRTTFGTPAQPQQQQHQQQQSTSHFVTVIEVKESSATVSSDTGTTTATTTTTTATTATTADGQLTDKFVSEPLAAVLDAKKKIPPRPPPKFIRRAAPVEPPTVPNMPPPSPAPTVNEPLVDVDGRTVVTKSQQSSSLDRNLKPSEILRQKSSDSLDVKLGSGSSVGGSYLSQHQQRQQHRNTDPEAGRQLDGLLVDELGRKLVGKAESFERQRRPDACECAHIFIANQWWL